MCGIFAILNNKAPLQIIDDSFVKGKNRGPEFSKLDTSFISSFN